MKQNLEKKQRFQETISAYSSFLMLTMPCPNDGMKKDNAVSVSLFLLD